MRKLAAVLCVVLMLAMAAPAFANPSISAPVITVIAAETAEAMEEGWWVEVDPADPSLYASQAVKDAVNAVNDPESTTTVKDVADALGVSAPGIDLGAYDFVTGFADAVLTNGSEVKFINSAVKITMTIDALKGETDLSNYLIMLINSETGEVEFIELDPSTFNSETGEITVDFPYLGTFSLIQK